MNDQDAGATQDVKVRGRDAGRWITLFAAVMVLLLALGSVLWPSRSERRANRLLLIYDSSGSVERSESLYRPLKEFLTEGDQAALDLVVVRDLAAFAAHVAEEPDFVLAPDGVSLNLARDAYLPLLAGRRGAPHNLRPRGVVVARRSAGDHAEPWLSRPDATVLGDSVSLTATGVLRLVERGDWPKTLAFGPDPFDHGPVLQALRLGAFDFAVVREWDAERFFAQGLLESEQYVMHEVTGPVPDAVLMVSRRVPRGQRLQCSERLSALGRGPDDEAAVQAPLLQGLARLRLAGFNVLLEPDFELLRRKYPARWPSGDE